MATITSSIRQRSVARRKKPVRRFGQARAVMKSAMAALMMSIAAAGSPASTGR